MFTLALMILLVANRQQDTEPPKPAIALELRPILCNFAKIRSARPQDKVSVRSGPGLKFSEIDMLRNGSTVYICDEGEGWYKVVYGGERTPCGVVSPNGIDKNRTSTCKTGWVKREWVDVLSG